MNSNISLKKEAEKLMKIKGNAKGETLLTHQKYIYYRQGEEGVRAVEEKMMELGYYLKFKEIKSLNWYPAAMGALVILVAKEIFNWTDVDIFDMGNSAPKHSFIIRFLMRYIFSPYKIFEESPRYWRAHYEFGTLEAVEFNEKEKYFLIRIKDCKFHPVTCVFFAGYSLKIAQFVIKSEKLNIKETKCVHRGDLYDEYIISW